jgi:3-phosphoshikimate 1-carboxyvinyltransferase
MKIIEVNAPKRSLRGDITLDGSKSISNRALIALALAGADPEQYLSGLSTSKDTRILSALLRQHDRTHFDAGDAGTTFRFMTAFLALQPGTQVLTGSERMRERPVGALVRALQDLGADIRFLEKEGYPPLQIGDFQYRGQSAIRIPADVSSQFLSALALIAPYLPDGLEIIPQGSLVSRPYLDMTVHLMRHFGATAEWSGDHLLIRPGGYTPRPFQVEADWSAASYWLSLAALADDTDLTLRGLQPDSWQGDAVALSILAGKTAEQAGVLPYARGLRYRWQPNGSLHLQRSATEAEAPLPAVLEKDFLECPDIAQTFAVLCAALGIQGLFSGLETLSIKETDRILALRQELAKVGVSFSKLPARFSKQQPDKTFYLLSGKAAWSAPPQFATYGDHRMAMSFAPLGMLAPVRIEAPEVVAKSYPDFWRDLEQVGVEMR